MTAEQELGMTDEEKFRFDLTGFLVRPAILAPDEIAAIVDQIDRIKHDPESLSPAERAMPGGAASLLIDHPKVMEVLHEIIGKDVRLEAPFAFGAKRASGRGICTAADRVRSTRSSVIAVSTGGSTPGWCGWFSN